MSKYKYFYIIKRIFSAFLVVVIFMPTAACSIPNFLKTSEERLGTQSNLDRGFHVVADEPQGFGLRFPGIIIGIEKTRREKLGVPALNADAHFNENPGGFNKQNLKEFHSKMDDHERTFISHIVESRLETNLGIPYIRNIFLYDEYGSDDRRPSNATMDVEGQKVYERSWNALKQLQVRIDTLLKNAAKAGRPYSHVIVTTMGWNTPQEKAIRNINSIHGNLLIAAGKASDFKPLFIAITWPSQWTAPLVSMGNKANDADEIGFVWANALMNRILVDLRNSASNTKKFKIVAIGHSLGARLVTRAAFSGEVLNPGVELSDSVDLVIGLQGAFSANRFLSERTQGREGAPYADYAKLGGHIVLTWSNTDSANPLANIVTGANYVGGQSGFERANDERYRKHFSFLTYGKDKKLDWDSINLTDAKRVIMIDASNLLKYSVLGSGGGSHSDIYNAYMGDFLFDIINHLAPSYK